MVSDRLEGDEVSTDFSPLVLAAGPVLKRLNGEPHKVLVKASDGSFYVVKMMDSFRGPNVQANKALGYELAKSLGLSVPDWRPIEFTQSYMERYFLFHGSELTPQIDRPGPGLYFGSRAMVQDHPNAVHGGLPENWHGRISNRNEFAGMLLLDLWANQVGQRKAIFVHSKDGASVTAVFTGNSQMFGGFWGREQQRRGAALFTDRRVYEGLDFNRAFSQWMQKAGTMDELALLRMARVIPCEWYDSGYLQTVASQLQARKWRVAQLLEEEKILLGSDSSESVLPTDEDSDDRDSEIGAESAEIA